MKQKIVIKVCMWCCDKGRSIAMKLAAAADGVESVALDGKHKDELGVVGEDVDSTKLTTALRKKLRHAKILEVSEAKKDDKKPPQKPDAPPPSKPPPQPAVTFVCHHCHCHHPVCYGSSSYYSCYCYCHCHRKDDKKPPAAAHTPPPPEVTFVCHHCHCHHPVCYGSSSYSCYCYCHFH